MSEQALDAHLDSQEQRPPEEMVMVEKSYLAWAGQKITQLEAKYNELILAVVSKYPDETRHETALRYIQEREQRVSGPSKVSE